MVEKTMLELNPYTVTIDGVTVIPLYMCFDENTCEIQFSVVNDKNFERKIWRRGKHIDYIFKTSIFNVPITINLQTNVIKKIRKFED